MSLRLWAAPLQESEVYGIETDSVVFFMTGFGPGGAMLLAFALDRRTDSTAGIASSPGSPDTTGSAGATLVPWVGSPDTTGSFGPGTTESPLADAGSPDTTAASLDCGTGATGASLAAAGSPDTTAGSLDAGTTRASSLTADTFGTTSL
jgi:hypothetical protein